MTDELKPCPFCGSRAFAIPPTLSEEMSGTNPKMRPGRFYSVIRCSNCGAAMDGPNYDRTCSTAAAMWNTRHTPDVQAATDAALESVATDLLGIAASMQKINPESTVSYRPEVAAYRKAASLLRSRIGTNPLTERDARIAELESLLAEAYADADDVLRPRIAELERENEILKTIPMKYRRMGFNAVLQDKIEELERELAEARKDAERYEAKLFALGAMEEPPCFKCGYNGPGYFQTATHPCAHNHHNAMLAEREKE